VSRALHGALLLAAIAADYSENAHAGRPFTTDDASVLEAGSCQLEAWVDRSNVRTEGWVAPACNFGLGIEWQLGGARAHVDGRNAYSQSYAQGKFAFVSVADHSWGLGLVVGVQRFALREAERGWSDPYVLVPLSFQVGTEGALLHLNAGWTRDKAEARDVTPWGVAFETPVTGTPVTLLGEAFGLNAHHPMYRLGGRWNAAAKNLDLDLSWVTRPGGVRSERYVSIGLYYKFDSILH